MKTNSVTTKIHQRYHIPQPNLLNWNSILACLYLANHGECLYLYIFNNLILMWYILFCMNLDSSVGAGGLTVGTSIRAPSHASRRTESGEQEANWRQAEGGEEHDRDPTGPEGRRGVWGRGIRRLRGHRPHPREALSGKLIKLPINYDI